MADGPAAAPRAAYLPALDSLRFFAFFSVFLTHTLPKGHAFYAAHGLPTAVGDFAAAGGFGVDLFFVLSGYLITDLLLKERDQSGRVDVKAFYVRRILRIWPLYFLALSLGVLFTVLHWEALTLRDVLGFSLLAGNWICALYGYPFSFIFPLWSVSIEEQFYLSWALVVRALERRGLAVVAAGVIVAANLARALAVWHRATPEYIWCSTFTRLDPIALGILLAIGLRGRLPDLAAWKRAALFAAGVALWTLEGRYLLPHPSAAAVLLQYPLAALAAVLMFLAALGPAGTTGRLRGHPALVYLGRISYGLYVFHYLGINTARHWFGLGEQTSLKFAGFWFGSLAWTVAAAALSYRCFERPFLRLKGRFSRVAGNPPLRG
ncbi:MAG TPA: acyltransferase [Terriglobales bacterium]|nr:acyltransferase [Terriglobales bacterium]